MPSGVRLGDSLIYEYGPDVRVEKAYSVETDANFRALTDANNMPIYLWRCYQRCGAVDWDEERQVGKHPLNNQETSSNEFWIEIGRGTEDEMDDLAIEHVRKLKGAANGK